MTKVLQALEFTTQTASILIATGSTPAEADTVANNLVMANLSGHDSHGVGMLPRYVDAVLEGGLRPNHSVRVVLDTGSLLTLDAQRGYGQIVGEQAMTLDIARAQAHGSCIMTLANAHHLGRIGHFAEMAVAQGLVALHFVNVLSRPVVVVVPQSNGLFGALLAFGEHKGYGLALACELLGGALTGGGTWHQPTNPAVRAVINGMLTILIDPAQLGTQTSFDEEALAFVEWLKAGPVAPGFDAVQIAGDPERATRAQRQANGIAVDAQTWQEMVAAGRKVGVTLPD